MDRFAHFLKGVYKNVSVAADNKEYPIPTSIYTSSFLSDPVHEEGSPRKRPRIQQTADHSDSPGMYIVWPGTRNP